MIRVVSCPRTDSPCLAAPSKFQRLVYLIQHQLAEGATIIESKLLPDIHSGRPVEVDVVVEGCIADVNVVVGIECTSVKRPATVEWVNEMVGKHADLHVDKTVLVSASGFTAEALVKAAKHGIEALSLGEAEKRDWAGWLCDLDALRFAGFTLVPLQVSATVARTPNLPSENPVQPEALIHEPGSALARSLKNQVHGILRQDRVFLPLARRWLKLNAADRPTSFVFQVAWDCPPETTLQAVSSEVLDLKKLVIQVRAEIRDAPLLAMVLKYRERNVVYAEVPDVLTENGTSSLLVTLLEKDGELEKGTVLLVDAKSSEAQVFQMKITPPDATDS
jgi:hypothetical protein